MLIHIYWGDDEAALPQRAIDALVERLVDPTQAFHALEDARSAPSSVALA